MELKWRNLDNKVNDLAKQTSVNSLSFRSYSSLLVCVLPRSHSRNTLSFLNLWILIQEVKKEIKSLEVLNEKLDFIQETWQIQGTVGGTGTQVIGSVWVHASLISHVCHYQWSSILDWPSPTLLWKRNVLSRPPLSKKQNRYCRQVLLDGFIRDDSKLPLSYGPLMPHHFNNI